MTLKEYQQLAKRTCPNLFLDQPKEVSDFLNISHMVYGMVSELPELQDAVLKKEDFVNAREELADIMWYIVNYCTFKEIDIYDLDLNKTSTSYDPFLEISYWIGEIANLEKRKLAYKKDYEDSELKYFLQRLIFSIIDAHEMCNDRTESFTLYDSLERNIEKLKVRFPEKFTTDNAINRNLEQERKVLE